MPEWEFILLLDGDVSDEVVLEKLYDLGCSDATFGIANGAPYGEFNRRASSATEAIVGAIGQVEEVPGIVVRRVEPDELVTMAEIAERLGRSRESVRLLAAGRRGDGSFPPPFAPFRGRSRLWRWADVAAWAGVLGPEELEFATAVRVVNGALEFRLRHRMPARERRLIESLAG
jgi:hypothetical protein